MGAVFQSRGTAVDGKTWCHDDFHTEVAVTVSTTATLNANKGIGPRGKCTWQVVAAADTHAPIIDLTNTPSVNALIQVVEWYDGTTAGLTTNGVIDPAKAAISAAIIAKDANSYVPSSTNKGVFINPANKSYVIASMPEKPVDNFSPIYSQDSAIDSQINSVGTALWHERDAGQKKGMVNAIDSTAVTMAYDVYKAQSTAYTALKTTYDTKKKEYEDAVTASKKDPKTTIPDRPDMPTPPGAYAGP